MVALERIAAKKTLGGRPIRIRQLQEPAECGECHIVFVSRSVSSDAEAKLCGHAAGKPILLVGESPGFASRRGIINSYQSGTNVRFELNPDKSNENRLSLYAKLLTLGTKASTSR